MWKYLLDSVQGTAHQATGMGLQDASAVCSYQMGREPILIAAVSDGAGSAKHAKVGSDAACAAVIRAVTHYLDQHSLRYKLHPDLPARWFDEARQDVLREAAKLEVEPRELACTLLLAVVAPHTALFAQLGDGAIVFHDGAQYAPALWPESSEYHNATYFLTQSDFRGHVQARHLSSRINEVAMFSDGLQMLALNYAEKTAHQPFFVPMFRSLRETQNHADLAHPLRAFLNSHQINSRTDDDKTLVLAVRMTDAPNPH